MPRTFQPRCAAAVPTLENQLFLDRPLLYRTLLTEYITVSAAVAEPVCQRDRAADECAAALRDCAEFFDASASVGVLAEYAGAMNVSALDREACLAWLEQDESAPKLKPAYSYLAMFVTIVISCALCLLARQAQ